MAFVKVGKKYYHESQVVKTKTGKYVKKETTVTGHTESKGVASVSVGGQSYIVGEQYAPKEVVELQEQKPALEKPVSSSTIHASERQYLTTVTPTHVQSPQETANIGGRVFPIISEKQPEGAMTEYKTSAEREKEARKSVRELPPESAGELLLGAPRDKMYYEEKFGAAGGVVQFTSASLPAFTSVFNPAAWIPSKEQQVDLSSTSPTMWIHKGAEEVKRDPVTAAGYGAGYGLGVAVLHKGATKIPGVKGYKTTYYKGSIKAEHGRRMHTYGSIQEADDIGYRLVDMKTLKKTTTPKVQYDFKATYAKSGKTSVAIERQRFAVHMFETKVHTKKPTIPEFVYVAERKMSMIKQDLTSTTAGRDVLSFRMPVAEPKVGQPSYVIKRRVEMTPKQALKVYKKKGLVKKVVYKDKVVGLDGEEGFGSFKPDTRVIEIQKGLPKTKDIKAGEFIIVPSEKTVLAHELGHARQLPKIIAIDKKYGMMVAQGKMTKAAAIKEGKIAVNQLELELGSPKFYKFKTVKKIPSDKDFITSLYGAKSDKYPTLPTKSKSDDFYAFLVPGKPKAGGRLPEQRVLTEVGLRPVSKAKGRLQPAAVSFEEVYHPPVIPPSMRPAPAALKQTGSTGTALRPSLASFTQSRERLSITPRATDFRTSTRSREFVLNLRSPALDTGVVSTPRQMSFQRPELRQRLRPAPLEFRFRTPPRRGAPAGLPGVTLPGGGGALPPPLPKDLRKLTKAGKDMKLKPFRGGYVPSLGGALFKSPIAKPPKITMGFKMRPKIKRRK